MKPQPKIVNRILDLLKESQTICVIGHVRPDGDCIGSQLAMTVALQNQGKKVYCWNEDRVPQKLAFMDPERLMQKPQKGLKFDVVLAVDCASLERFGKLVNYTKDRSVFVNVDHHQSNTRYGDINWIVSRAPSTGELIYRLIRAANWPVTVPIADCLFTAISTDTGSFQYPSTTPNTLHVAADLVNRGANLGRICEEVYQSFPLSRVRLLQRVFNHFRLTLDNRIGYFWLKPSDFSRTGCDASDSEGLIDHIRAIEPVQVAILFEEMQPNLVRVSLRSKSPDINVNEIAGKFGGGGHTAAAGARIAGNPSFGSTPHSGGGEASIRQTQLISNMHVFDTLDGAILVDKPAGPTSHDVVGAVRRWFQIDKAGHCGTLDPAATGLLLLVLGRATKLSDKFMGSDKTYEGTVKFGETTDSYDADGELVASLPVPPITLEELNKLASEFHGDQMQTPPMVSAIKKAGVPLYKLARKGIEVERKPRFIHIYKYQFSDYREPIGTFEVVCTKGTYVRSLAHEMGEKIGCGAHLASLRRTSSGPFNVVDAIPLKELLNLSITDLEKRVIPFLKLTEMAKH